MYLNRPRWICTFIIIEIVNAYAQIAGLIHGETVSLEGDDEEEGGAEGADDEGEDTGDASEASAPDDALGSNRGAHIRPEVIIPTVTNNDAAALETPAPGTVHLICVDPPYYNSYAYRAMKQAR